MHGQLYLWLIHPEKAMCEAFQHRFANFPKTKIIQCSFEELSPHDCFATAANSFGIMNAGIDAALIRFFGPQLMKEIQFRIMDEFLGEQPIGTTIIHPTKKPEYPFIAHTPTMKVPGSIIDTDNIYQATWAVFLAVNQHNLVNKNKILTLVLPAFGTGFGAVSFDEAARQMAVAYKHYLNPPHRLDWDFVISRHRALIYDGTKRVLKG